MEFKTMVLLAALLIVFAPVAYVLLMNPAPSTTGTGSGSGASYIIYQVDSTTYAQNGRTGSIDYSGTDSATIINQAITAIGNVGGSINIMRGTYFLTHQIDVMAWSSGGTYSHSYSNITITSDGAVLWCDYPTGSTKSIVNYGCFSNNCVINLADSSGITINGLIINLNNVQGISGIACSQFVTYASNLLIENCQIYNGLATTGTHYNGEGIMLNGAIHSTVQNCYFNNCFIGVRFEGYTYTDSMSRDNSIINCRMIDCHAMGVYLVGDRSAKVLNNYIQYSEGSFLPFGTSGIWVGEGLATDLDYYISGNTILNCTWGINLANAWNITCTQNIIKGCLEVGIAIGGSMVLSNNIIMDNGQNLSAATSLRSGIWIGNAYFRNDIITGNIIGDDQGTPTQKYGVYDNRGSSATRVYSNNVFVSPAGVTSVYSSGDSIFTHNYGYRTENAGVAVILAGQTSVTVYHLLSVTPDMVVLTGSNAASVDCYVSTITPTYFIITVPVAVGGNTDVYWYAEALTNVP